MKKLQSLWVKIDYQINSDLTVITCIQAQSLCMLTITNQIHLYAHTTTTTQSPSTTESSCTTPPSPLLCGHRWQQVRRFLWVWRGWDGWRRRHFGGAGWCHWALQQGSRCWVLVDDNLLGATDHDDMTWIRGEVEKGKKVMTWRWCVSDKAWWRDTLSTMSSFKRRGLTIDNKMKRKTFLGTWKKNVR